MHCPNIAPILVPLLHVYKVDSIIVSVHLHTNTFILVEERIAEVILPRLFKALTDVVGIPIAKGSQLMLILLTTERPHHRYRLFVTYHTRERFLEREDFISGLLLKRFECREGLVILVVDVQQQPRHDDKRDEQWDVKVLLKLIIHDSRREVCECEVVGVVGVIAHYERVVVMYVWE